MSDSEPGILSGKGFAILSHILSGIIAIWHILLHFIWTLPYMLIFYLSGILSGIYSGIPSGLHFCNLSDILSAEVLSGILSGTSMWQFIFLHICMWHHLAFHLTCLRTFSLTFYLLYIYKHSIWHSFSHSFWHMSGSVYAHIVIWSSLSILSIWNSARASVKASRLKKLETLTWQVGNDATEAS